MRLQRVVDVPIQRLCRGLDGGWVNTRAGRAGSVYSSLNHAHRVLPDEGVRVLSQEISGCGEGLASVISLPAPEFPLECIKAWRLVELSRIRRSIRSEMTLRQTVFLLRGSFA